MQINSINNSQSFQARIKMNKPNLKVLAQTALGTSVLAAGAATVGDGALSIGIEHVASNNGEHAEMFEKSIPVEVLHSHAKLLFENNGGRGLPALSTVLPPAMLASGSYTSNIGSNVIKDAFAADINNKNDKKLPS